MGCIDTISIDKFPEQSKQVGSSVDVCFHYNVSKTIKGVILRDDLEDPFRTLIQLSDGRVIDSTECQWRTLSIGTMDNVSHDEIVKRTVPCLTIERK